jgi:hypothetical protein
MKRNQHEKYAIASQVPESPAVRLFRGCYVLSANSKVIHVLHS